jgi:protein-disulfide isomerase/uncharacterized membrane protein
MDALRANGLFGLAALALVASFTVVPSDYQLIPQLVAALAVCAGLVQRAHRFGTVATAVLNFGFSKYLFDQKVDSALGKSLCDLDSLFSCGAVNDSPWSEIFGIPITLLGMGFYGGLIAAAAFAAKDDVRFDQTSFLANVFSVGFSVLLGYQILQIGTICLFCVSMYVGNAILLWAAWRGLQANDTTWSDSLGIVFNSRHVTLVGVGVALAAVYGNNVYKASVAMPTIPASSGGTADAKPADVVGELATLYKSPDGSVALSGDEPILGNPNAPYVVVEFADYGCPHCARAGKELKDLVAAYPDDIQVRFKYFPRSGPCNPELDPYDETLCQAAYAAECAHAQGKFWEMSNQLFTNQGYFQPEQLEFMAKEIGVDFDVWKTCMTADVAPAAVTASAKAGLAAEIMGTPTMLVQGLTDDGFVEVTRGVPAIATLVEAHKSGVPLPSPG